MRDRGGGSGSVSGSRRRYQHGAGDAQPATSGGDVGECARHWGRVTVHTLSFADSWGGGAGWDGEGGLRVARRGQNPRQCPFVRVSHT